MPFIRLAKQRTWGEKSIKSIRRSKSMLCSNMLIDRRDYEMMDESVMCSSRRARTLRVVSSPLFYHRWWIRWKGFGFMVIKRLHKRCTKPNDSALFQETWEKFRKEMIPIWIQSRQFHLRGSAPARTIEDHLNFTLCLFSSCRFCSVLVYLISWKRNVMSCYQIASYNCRHSVVAIWQGGESDSDVYR